MEERPKVGVGVIVIKDGKVLMQKRKGAHGEGTWSFPGGHLEYYETLESYAIHEVQEEIGIKIKDIRFATITNDIFKLENKHYITIFMIANYLSGIPEVKELDKTEKVDWFSWHSLPQPLFIPIQNLLKQNFTPF